MALRCLLFMSFFSASMAACSYCDHGTCSNSVCQCQSGYTGVDCSLPVVVCPDGRTCMNGSECVQNNEKDSVTNVYKYHCDCSKSFGVSSYAGLQCEYSATVVCEYGKSSSISAFCTNGGTCLQTTFKGQAHAGCSCPIEFEGTHCQYLLGTAPAQDLAVTYSASGNGAGLTGLAIFFISAITVGVLATFSVVVWRKHQRKIREEEGFPEDEIEKKEFDEVTEVKKVPDII